MSFWNQCTTLSLPLAELLFKQDITLREILEEPELLQECRSQNAKLIDFLARTEILRELVQLTTREPESDGDDIKKYKYAYLACEVLTSETPLLVQTLANDESLLSELYSFLESDPPLNPLLASYCSRIFAVLISRPSEQNWFSYQVTCLQVIEFFKSKGNYIDLLLKHMGTSAIMDLVQKLYTKIEGFEMKENLLTWLDEGELVEKLVNLLRPDAPSDSRSNACELLCGFINDFHEMYICSNEKPEPDRIIRKIESEELIAKLLDVMLQEPRNEGSIVGGISVLITSLLANKKDCNDDAYESWASTPGASKPSMVVKNTYTAITPHLPTLLDVLKNPPYKPPVRTTVGTLQTPFGATRVEVVRLISVLVSAGNEDFLAQLRQFDFFNTLLDLFFEYPWNNFLHTELESTLHAAFASEELTNHILIDCRLIQRILSGWESNEAQEASGKPRMGYMGHLIKIASDIVEYSYENPLDSKVDAETLSKWQEFVATSLTKVLGDQRSTTVGWEEHDSNCSDNFYDEFFRSYYQLQALAPSFAENLFQSDQFGDSDENGVRNTVVLKLDFEDSAKDDNFAVQSALFSQICAQKLQTFVDDNEEWNVHDRAARPWNDDGSSDDEGSGPGDGDADDWPENDSSVAPVEQSNPWSAEILSAGSPDQGWATFDPSPFLANFGFDLSSTIATSTPGDVGPVPFDLTPTEAPLFSPSENDSLPPTFMTVEPPEEVQQNTVDDETSPPPPSATTTTVEVPPIENDAPPTGDVPSTQPSEIVEEKEETAEIVDTVSSAQVIAFTDLVDQLQETTLDDPSSSCQSGDSQSSNAASVIAAFPTETVIDQTEALGVPEVVALPSPIPSANGAADVATELAQLLAEVSDASQNVSVVPNVVIDNSESELRTPSDAEEVTNGPVVDEDSKWVKDASGDADCANVTGDNTCDKLITNPILTNCLQTHEVE